MMVHIHPGNLGDDDLEAGMSDLDNTVHRWLNPVAMLTSHGEIGGYYALFKKLDHHCTRRKPNSLR